MPAPPIPTMWTCRGDDRSRSRRASSLLTCHLLDEVGEARGGVGAAERPGVARNRREPSGIGEQSPELGVEAGGVAFGVRDDDGGSGSDQGLGVARLVI